MVTDMVASREKIFHELYKHKAIVTRVQCTGSVQSLVSTAISIHPYIPVHIHVYICYIHSTTQSTSIIGELADLRRTGGGIAKKKVS